MATLLIGRWFSGRNQAAAKESVDDQPRVEQIGKRRETGIAMFTDGRRWPVIAGRFPIGPIGGDERSTAIWKHHEQIQNAAATNCAHDMQGAALKRVPLTQYGHRIQVVVEMGSV
jgi:hypothetical protein